MQSSNLQKAIPNAFLNSNNGGLIVVLDEQGRIQNEALGPQSTLFANINQTFGQRLRAGADISTFFKIPAEFDFYTCPDINAAPERQVVFGSRNDSLGLSGEPEEFHSLFSLMQIKLFRSGDKGFLGFIWPTLFLGRIVAENHLRAFFCLNSSNRLIGFNKRFQLLLGDVSKPLPLLGRPIGDFLLPSPEEIQKTELAGIAMPSDSAFSTKWIADSPVWQEGPPRILDLSVWFDWQREDLCVEISAEKGLPCFVVGDKSEPNEWLLDREGYLAGPSEDGKALILKKRGDLIAYVPAPPEVFSGGRYRFLKLRNAFLIQREGETLFAHVDYECMDRGKTRPSLHLRSGQTCLLRSVSVSTMAAQARPGVRNPLVSVKGGNEGLFLLTCRNCSFSFLEREPFTLYMMQDVSDVRERMETLEGDYLALLQKERKTQALLKEYSREEDRFIGSSDAVKRVREEAEKAARSAATILVTGPTGTGKEVLARFIHNRSAFADGPFVKVDCATLPSALIESLLFGHEKGAFTGALAKNEGFFQQAQKGTLFLDEINNLDLITQAKLLQFLQDQTITPVGGQKPVKLDLRVVLASNVSLEAKVAQGLFREDLYYRIAVVVLNLPPLKERPEDIPALSRYFLELFNVRYNKNITALSPGVERLLSGHSWPGNVRELKNVLERAYLYCAGPEITEQFIRFSDVGPGKQSGRKTLTVIEKSPEEVIGLFEKHQGIAKRVARELNVTRPTLYAYFKKYGIKPNEIRKNPRRMLEGTAIAKDDLIEPTGEKWEAE